MAILVIDDDTEVHELLKKSLQGYHLIFANNASEGHRSIKENKHIELIILDVFLPDGNGMNLFIDLKSETHSLNIPIIFLTSSNQINDKVAGLSLGADDYITKPFDRRELRARVDMRIKKAQNARGEGAEFRCGDLVFQTEEQQVYWLTDHKKTNLNLTRLEYKLLFYFSHHVDHVVSRQQLIENIWQDDTSVSDRTVDIHVSHLRKKIQSSSLSIISCYGEGYKLTQKDPKNSQLAS